ncbi:MAG: helix-turn-helix domain-containing protein [Atopobiaceae bacterium]|nr:helix-turn-helix domain-containing protein [Atopobiaceae bacterium]
MNVSLPIIAEATTSLSMEVIRSIPTRDISGISKAPQEARANELLIVESGSLSSLPQGIEHLLVVGDIAASDEPNVPDLAVVRSGLTTEEVWGAITSAFLGLMRWDSRMLEAIVARQGVDSVLAIAAERLANPIALFDSRQALLSYAGSLPPGAENTIWGKVLHNRYATNEFFTPHERAHLAKSVQGIRPFFMEPSRDPGHQHLVAVLRVNGQEVGSVGQVDINRPFTPGQVDLVDLVVDRLRFALSLRLGNDTSDDDAFLLRTALDGNRADRELFLYHIDKLGLDAAAGFELTLCTIPDDQKTFSGDRALANRIRKALPHAVVTQYENGIVMLGSAGAGVPSQAFSLLVSSFDLTTATSEPFFDVDGVRAAYEQCLITTQVAKRQSLHAVRFSDVFEHALPIALEQGVDPHVLCDRSLLELTTHGYKGDVERGRTMVQELYFYLIRGCNSRSAAREVFLHRNTLIYHIELLERLLGVKLNELDAVRTLFLEVSCLIALEA